MAQTFREAVVHVAPVTFQATVGFGSDVTFEEDVRIEGDLRVPSGQMSLGDLRTSNPAVLELKGNDGGKDKPASLVLYDHNGDPRYLWVDSGGRLRIGDDYPDDEEDGDILLTESQTATSSSSGGNDSAKSSKSKKQK